MKRKPTLNDVAALAGVSNATVSNAINGTKHVGDDVRAKIDQAIAALDYIPNSLAKSLKMNESRLIGLMIWDILNPGFPPIVRGIEDTLRKNGFNVLLCNTDSDPVKELQYLKVLLGRQVDGLVVALAGPDVSHFLALNIPVVFFNRIPECTDCNVVTTDNAQGAYLATEHLLRHGYRRIAIVAGVQYISVGRERFRGYRKALEDGGRAFDERFVRVGPFTVEGGYQAMKELMEQDQPPDAVFTSNNILTLGALRYLRETGYRIPQDIAVVSYDDPDWATLLDPPLTCVDAQNYQMGISTGELLLERVQEKTAAKPKRVVLPLSLTVRRSCGCP